MIRTINESADGDFAPAVGQYLDLRLFMKYLAVESFVVNGTVSPGSPARTTSISIAFGMVSRSSFRRTRMAGRSAYLDVPVSLRFDANVLVRRAVADPALREAFLSELRECMVLAAEPAADDPRGWLEREVDRETALVSTAIADDPVFPYSFDDFRAADRPRCSGLRRFDPRMWGVRSLKWRMAFRRAMIFRPPARMCSTIRSLPPPSPWRFLIAEVNFSLHINILQRRLDVR